MWPLELQNLRNCNTNFKKFPHLGWKWTKKVLITPNFVSWTFDLKVHSVMHNIPWTFGHNYTVFIVQWRRNSIVLAAIVKIFFSISLCSLDQSLPPASYQTLILMSSLSPCLWHRRDSLFFAKWLVSLLESYFTTALPTHLSPFFHSLLSSPPPSPSPNHGLAISHK